jgi:hypothetical protein
VLDQIENLSSWDRNGHLQNVLERIRHVTGDYVLISAEEIRQLLPFLEQCRDALVAELGTADPFEAIEMDDKVPGLDPVDAKWGKGKGWQVYCVLDLLRAAAHSQETGEAICVSFD